MSNKNEVFEYLIDQLRHQVNNNQCEDLAHEVQSLKNQLRDMSALVAELQKELEILGCEYRRALDYALSDAPEQSCCRKDDTQECEHDWYFYNKGASMMCKKCGLKSPDRKKEDTQGCGHTNTAALRKGFAPGFTKKCLDCGVNLK